MLRIVRTTMVITTLLFCIVAVAASEPLTKEQGDEILKELREIRILLERQQRPQTPPGPPQPEKIRIKDGGEHILGRKDAPVTVIEYTDYQCPYCGRFETATFPEIKKNYIDTGKVRFIHRDMPLSFHPFAIKAAQAVRCAGEQGKFWEMKDLVFKNQSRLDAESLAGYAKAVGLDVGKYSACASSDRYLKEIKDEAEYANSLGITGTPSFAIGTASGDTIEGIKVVGAQPYAAFDAVFKGLLEGPKNK